MEETQKGTPYLCATPIGNLEDMTYRAVRMLGEVELIAAEDTRHTRQLLTHFDIHTKLTSYHEHNKFEKGPELINLPRGTQIYPHEASLNRAADAGVGPIGASMSGYNFRRQEPLRPDWGSVGSVRSSSPAAAAAPLIEKEQGAITASIMIPKIADQITVREEADIDKIGVAIARSLERSMRNRGNWSFAEAM